MTDVTNEELAKNLEYLTPFIESDRLYLDEAARRLREMDGLLAAITPRRTAPTRYEVHDNELCWLYGTRSNTARLITGKDARMEWDDNLLCEWLPHSTSHGNYIGFITTTNQGHNDGTT